jgi:hypothetical protein
MFRADVLIGLFRRFRSLVLRREVRVVGRCNGCGRCCRSLLLCHEGRWLRSRRQFERLSARTTDFFRFSLVGRSADGFLLFDCTWLRDDNLCSCHEARPALCRNYPSKSLYYQGGQTLDDCGFSFEAVTFRDVLFGRKPFKPADFSAVLRREIQQDKDEQT